MWYDDIMLLQNISDKCDGVDSFGQVQPCFFYFSYFVTRLISENNILYYTLSTKYDPPPPKVNRNVAASITELNAQLAAKNTECNSQAAEVRRMNNGLGHWQYGKK